MKNKFLILFLYLHTAVSAQFTYQRYDKENIIEKAEFLKNKFNPKYLLIGDFLPVKEGSEIKLAKVFTNAGWGYIDEKGNEIIASRHKKIGYFKDGLVIGERIVDNPAFKGNFITEKYLYNYAGVNLAGNGEIFKEFSVTDWYSKDYLHLQKDNNYLSRGIISKEGKVLVPLNYNYVLQFRDQFFAFSPIENTSDLNLNKVDIYSMKGKFLKNFISQGFSAEQDQLIVHHYKGSYFINNETYEKLDNRVFDYISEIKESKKFKFAVSFINKSTDVFTYYLLDNELKIFNEDFPNTYIYNDEFLVQKIADKKGKTETIALWNFKKEKFAEYSYADFVIAEYFGAGKLTDTEFIKKNLEKWRTLKRTTYYLESREKDFQPRSYPIKKFYIENSFERTTATGYANSNTGEIIFNKNTDNYRYIENIASTGLFQLHYENEALGMNIQDINGKVLKEFIPKSGENFEARFLDGNNVVSNKFLRVNTTKDTLRFYKTGTTTIYSIPDFLPLTEKRQKEYTPYFSDKELEYFYIKNEKDLIGITDKNRKMIIPQKYIGYNKTYLNSILKENSDKVLILNAPDLKKVMEIEFSPGIMTLPKRKDENGQQFQAVQLYGFYIKGFYLFNDDKMLMDRYGNIIDTPEGFNTYSEY